jgi:N-methylhydantoinase A/oxoprolinase/acetone carboxylase beta subunit/N-methylhydantoinase B/oxoprolinase/acetone carboxylase alpha subunit
MSSAPLPQASSHARIGADVGGTFTDVISIDDAGRLAFRKVLSTPPDYDRAVVGGIRALGEGRTVDEVVHATTVATNAVLERRGARIALLTTAGFRDVLELRRVRMPRLYDLFWDKPAPLVPRELRFEVDERMAAGGDVLMPLDEDGVRQIAARIRDAGVETVAVCLLHAHRHPAHERRVGELLAEALPDVAISLSSDVIREQQEYERTAATAVNAYVRPLMERYLRDIRAGMDALAIDGPLTLMQSAGGVMDVADAAARPVYALESGPAAGVVAAMRLAREHGLANAIAFDMGGTTAKASLIEDGRVAWSREYEVGAALSTGSRLLRGEGELLRVPSLDISEVGAGGGSVAWLDGAGALHVGPHSAGAAPGPACYGLGGTEPTVTDANVVLGYISDGPLADGDLTVSRTAAAEAIDGIAARLRCDLAEAARGIHELANAAMMRALRSVSSEKGRDPADFALVAYGGSGPVHAAGLAAELGIETVLVPPIAGGFSAAGLLFARPEFHDVRFCRVDPRGAALGELQRLAGELKDGLSTRAGARGEVELRWSADVRYRGQSWDIEIPVPGQEIDAAALSGLIEGFEAEYERTYGVRQDPGSPVEIRALRLALLGPEPAIARLHVDTDPDERPVRERAADFRDGQGPRPTPVCRRDELGDEARPGPLLVDDYDTTVVVPPGFTVSRAGDGTLVLRASGTGTASTESAAAAVTEGIVANALSSIADEMATTIFRTAHSTVVRDGMDFSAAICGPTGETVAQAVTIPLHLGSIPTALDALLAEYADDLRAGDVFIMNDPFGGGMHTPDIFIVTPVFDEADTLLGFAVATAHHADVGGRLPGSASCDNVDIFQEGLRLPWMRLFDAGKPVDAVHKVLRANVRLPATTFGDIRAQVAACTVAGRGLRDLAARYTSAGLIETMTSLLDRTERLVRAEIAAWPDGEATFTDHLDSDGIDISDVPITARVRIDGDRLVADFSESAPMVRGALNATRSFTQASVYHAVLSAITADVPHTAGAFRPIEVITRPGTVTHVSPPGASSMRGVTGFRIFDALAGALAQLIPHRVPAAGEGGNTLAIFSSVDEHGERFIYYELVVGTWGARPTADGNDGLSNPCATGANIPVEVAESEFPILVERYGLVADSGGAGRYRGGLAIERAWRTLTPQTTLQVRSDRQQHRPYGLAGGGPGGASANVVHNGHGPQRRPPMFADTITAGTRYVHTMAGGGGWGDPLERDPGAVGADVRAGKVSVGAANEHYGVVVDASGNVDADATATLRASRR